MDLRKFVVSEFVLGNNAVDLAGRYASNFHAKKVFIVSDPGVRSVGLVKTVEDSLNNEGIEHVIFTDLTPNPKDYEVMKGAELFKEKGCDVIIAIGGGSVIDCAKGIGIVTSNNKHICDFEGVDEVKIPIPPLICIPTTAGTAADISQFAIITNTEENRKIAIVSKAVVPDISLIDGTTTTSMSKELTASTGMDALVHAIEAYISNASSHVTDLHAIEAIKLISTNLTKAVEEPENLEFRNNMMLASLYAGMAFSNASLGMVHAMAHSLGGLKDTAHGECNAILLEHSIDYNFDKAAEKYTKILEALGNDVNNLNPTEIKISLFKTIKELRLKLGVDFGLKQIGIKKHELNQLAINAYNDVCLATNPKEISIKQIEDIYEKIF